MIAISFHFIPFLHVLCVGFWYTTSSGVAVRIARRISNPEVT